jgi:mono/diheme cytochrome c family protein
MKWIAAFIAGLIAAPLLFAIAAVAGLFPSNSISPPPGWETSLGGRALDASLEKRAKGVSNPIKAGDAAALAAGQKLYATNCAGCHGTRVAPSEWGSKAFYPRVPQFWQGDASDLAPEEAFVAIRDGVRYSGMGAWRHLMKPDDMWRVANFVAHIHDARSRGGQNDSVAATE